MSLPVTKPHLPASGIILLAMVLLGPVAMAANAERPGTVRYQLSNGDTVSGVIVEEDKHSVTLRSPVYGEITLPRPSILPAPRPDPQTAPVQPPAKPVDKLAKTDVKPAAKPGVAPTVKPWRTKVEFGLNRENNLNDTTRYNVLAQSEKTIGRHTLRANARTAYSKQNDKTTADRTEAGLRWRQNLPERFFTQTQTTYFRDRVAHIDVNLDQNVGIGYGLIDSPRVDFNLGVGLTGQYREADNLDANTGALAEVFQDQTIKLNDSTKIVQSLNVQYWPNSPLITTTARDEENLKWRFSTTLVGKLTESISLNLRYEYDFDNAVSNPAARSTQRITSSLGYLF
ncbi:MAG: DUF481 domain-containing protein [Verrucomicrobiota bacterium]